MERSRSTIWYEDLERHRQPSLYYLSPQDDKDGPHLICDWNGAPNDSEEYDIDFLSKLIEKKGSDKKLIDHIDEPEPKPPKITNSKKTTVLPLKNNSSQTMLTENDGSRLELLTMPPVVYSLLRRLLARENMNAQEKETITEEVEKSPHHSKSSASSQVELDGIDIAKKGKARSPCSKLSKSKFLKTQDTASKF